MKKLIPTIAFAALTALAPFAAHADVYSGNGATGFGGPVGNGSLTITSTPSGSVTFTLNPAGGSLGGGHLVLYLDTVSGGLNNTSTLTDNADGGRRAISGYYPSNPNDGNATTRTVANFASGFGADYAIDFEDGFVGLFALPASGGSPLIFTPSTAPSQTGAAYSLTLEDSDIGKTTGTSFNFVGTLISDSDYRSNETIGASTTTPDTGAAPNVGFNGSVTFTPSDLYTLAPAAAPESSGLATVLMVAGVLGVCVMGRRRYAVQNAA